MVALTPIRHDVAIAGRVTNAEGRPVPNAVVMLTECPPAFSARLSILASARGSAWANLVRRPDRTLCGADGSYRFVDLPAGRYRLKVSAPGSAYRDATVDAVVATGSPQETKSTIVNIQFEIA